MGDAALKVCSRCGEAKVSGDFGKCTAARDGLQAFCKKCQSQISKVWRASNVNKIKKNREGWRERNSEKERETVRAWQRAHPKKVRDIIKKWNSENKERIKVNKKIWELANPEKVKKNRNKYQKSRYDRDENFKIRKTLRTRINSALRAQGASRTASAVKDLGCTIPEFKAYMEGLFKPGMTWDNHSLDGWHIDHIRPLVAFDLSDPEQQKLACHYTNLQPLWAEDNLSKSKTPSHYGGSDE